MHKVWAAVERVLHSRGRIPMMAVMAAVLIGLMGYVYVQYKRAEKPFEVSSSGLMAGFDPYVFNQFALTQLFVGEKAAYERVRNIFAQQTELSHYEVSEGSTYYEVQDGAGKYHRNHLLLYTASPLGSRLGRAILILFPLCCCVSILCLSPSLKWRGVITAILAAIGLLPIGLALGARIALAPVGTVAGVLLLAIVSAILTSRLRSTESRVNHEGHEAHEGAS